MPPQRPFLFGYGRPGRKIVHGDDIPGWDLDEIDLDERSKIALTALDRWRCFCGAGLSMADTSNIPNAAQLASGAKRKRDAQYGATGPPLPAGIERSRCACTSLSGDWSTRRPVWRVTPSIASTGTPSESPTGAISLIVSGAFCDLGRQRQLVG